MCLLFVLQNREKDYRSYCVSLPLLKHSWIFESPHRWFAPVDDALIAVLCTTSLWLEKEYIAIKPDCPNQPSPHHKYPYFTALLSITHTNFDLNVWFSKQASESWTPMIKTNKQKNKENFTIWHSMCIAYAMLSKRKGQYMINLLINVYSHPCVHRKSYMQYILNFVAKPCEIYLIYRCG